jgi:RNA polymerase sigma-70 factor (ECF subfamily)
MASDTDLDELLIATARHDQAAFRLLYDRTSPKLFGIALKICRNRAMAEDVLQDVFTDVWKKAGNFDRRRGHAGAWLSVIARNRSIDALRRQGRGFLGATTGSEEEMTATPDPSMAGDGGVDTLTLVDCLNRLETRERDLVLRAYYKGETREDLAQAFDAPVNTIKTWLRRGLISLKTCLDE